MKGREAMTSKRLFRVRLSGRVVRCSEPPPNKSLDASDRSNEDR
jgi:hypothetical protein